MLCSRNHHVRRMITDETVKHIRTTNVLVKVQNGQMAFPPQDQGPIVLMSPHLLLDVLVCKSTVRAFDAREIRGDLLMSIRNATDLHLWNDHLGTK